MVSGEVLENEQVGVEMRDSCICQHVTKDGENLVGIEDPVFGLESVGLIESGYAFGYPFGAGHDDFHLPHWSTGALQLPQHVHAYLVGGFNGAGSEFVDIEIVDLAFSAAQGHGLVVAFL